MKVSQSSNKINEHESSNNMDVTEPLNHTDVSEAVNIGNTYELTKNLNVHESSNEIEVSEAMNIRHTHELTKNLNVHEPSNNMKVSQSSNKINEHESSNNMDVTEPLNHTDVSEAVNMGNTHELTKNLNVHESSNEIEVSEASKNWNQSYSSDYLNLSDLKGVGDVVLSKLHLLNITNIKELVNFFPYKFLDLSLAVDENGIQDGSFVFSKIKIEIMLKPFKKGKLCVFRVCGKMLNYRVNIVYFNSFFQSKRLAIGTEYTVYGKIGKLRKAEAENEGEFELVNPILYEDNLKCCDMIKPIYKTKGLIAQSTFGNIVKQALTKFSPTEILTKESLRLKTAYYNVHFPQTMGQIKSAKERIALDKTVAIIASHKLSRDCQNLRKDKYKILESEIENFISILPFKLTDTQDIAVKQIVKAFKSSKLLNSMIIGDVGSGKTIVAFLSAYVVALSKRQTLFMVPTEILARQHFSNFKNMLTSTNVKTSILLGSDSKSEKSKVYKDFSEGKIDILIGTHSLLNQNLQSENISLIIVDEQHRFGVNQRTTLLDKNKNTDMITLSATPIPRSLQLGLFKNITFLNIEKRHESTNIKTRIVSKEKKSDMFDFIVNRIRVSFDQAYIVTPRIEDDEGIEMASCQSIFKELSEKYGSKISIGLLHGKMSDEEKISTLDKFNKNEISVLVATSVIEVGIDVKNADIIVILDAEMFGLSALHQLRGRVGRNGQESYCFLCPQKDVENQRLSILVQSNDGMKIAEKDAELRGMGDIYGQNQSGNKTLLPDLTLSIINKAKGLAEDIDIESNFEYLSEIANEYNLFNISFN